MLPGEGWAGRVADDRPDGPAEAFLALVRRQVYARATGRDGPYSLETEARPPFDGVVETAAVLDQALARLQKPLTTLAGHLRARLDDEADELDTATASGSTPRPAGWSGGRSTSWPPGAACWRR